jgi:lactate dehydrogenase-like 2-hydroxyacid dehydrogenase
MMTVKVVVLDAGLLPDDVDFPPLEAARYGWEQYRALSDADIVDRCWRADILISLGTPIDGTTLEKLHRLKLVIGCADSLAGIDQATARARGVELLAFPEPLQRIPAAAQDLCNRMAQAIDHYLRNSDSREGDR